MAHNPLPAAFVQFSYVFSQYENSLGRKQNTYTTRSEIHTQNTNIFFTNYQNQRTHIPSLTQTSSLPPSTRISLIELPPLRKND